MSRLLLILLLAIAILLSNLVNGYYITMLLSLGGIVLVIYFIYKELTSTHYND